MARKQRKLPFLVTPIESDVVFERRIINNRRNYNLIMLLYNLFLAIEQFINIIAKIKQY